jgi:CMP-N,N'-diacetyllegionaminic acid synthase
VKQRMLSEIVALIPARGGSKGVPRKNVRPLAGKPLLAHTIEQARAVELVNRVVVSTDDEEIGEVARQYGAEVVWRPAEISGDTASSESALRHALEFLKESGGYEPDYVVFLQCTSPLRWPGDIDRAIETLLAAEADSLLSVVPSHRFLWTVNQGGQPVAVNYDYANRPRRQDRAAEYVENGSIYVFKPWVLRELNNRLGGRIALYMMDEWSGVDIDSAADFALCEWLLNQGNSRKL